MKQKHWTELIRPQRFDVRARGGDAATVVVEPLERGYGFTLGTALRRIMLSTLPGWAVAAARVSGLPAGADSIAGVSERLDEVLLNLKEIAIRAEPDAEPRRLAISGAGPVVTAADIGALDGVEIVNPDHVICTLEKGARFEAELVIAYGRGYRPATLQPPAGLPEGFTALDSVHSPAKRVSFTVESARLGQVLDYDRLVFEIDTDGTVSAEQALTLAAGILHDQLGVFINFEEEQRPPAPPQPDPLGFNPVLLKRVDELELSVRASNCMRHENVTYLGDLVTRTEAELMRVPNFGRKSLNEIKAALAALGLSLGTEAPEWPPEDIEALARQYADD